MDLIIFILYYAVVGIIVGALGRLAVPGPNPMSIGMTILVGIGGSLLGGLVGQLLLGRQGGMIFGVAGAALIVWILRRFRREPTADDVGPPDRRPLA